MPSRSSYTTIVVVGLSLDFEREYLDREDFELPGNQNKLIKKVPAAAKGPVIIGILSAAGVNVSEYASSQLHDSTVEFPFQV